MLIKEEETCKNFSLQPTFTASKTIYWTEMFIAIKDVVENATHVTVLLMKPLLLYQKQLDGHIG